MQNQWQKTNAGHLGYLFQGYPKIKISIIETGRK